MSNTARFEAEAALESNYTPLFSNLDAKNPHSHVRMAPKDNKTDLFIETTHLFYVLSLRKFTNSSKIYVRD